MIPPAGEAIGLALPSPHGERGGGGEGHKRPPCGRSAGRTAAPRPPATAQPPDAEHNPASQSGRGTPPANPDRHRRARARGETAPGRGAKSGGVSPRIAPAHGAPAPPKPAGRAPQGGPGNPRAGRRANPHRRERRPPAREARTEEGRTPGQAGAARHAARGANPPPQKTRLGGLAAARHGTAPDPPQAGRAEKPGGRGGRGQRARPPPPEAPGGRANQPPGQTRKAGLQRRDTARPRPPGKARSGEKGGGQTRPHTSPRQQRGARLSEGRSDPRPAAATAEGLGACAQAGEDGGQEAPQDEPARPPPGRGTGGGNPVPRGGTGFRPCGRSVGRTAAPRPPATVSGARLPIGSRAAYPYLILGQY